ncbi:MAG: sugar ABC transporter ATP-binding protein [Verrucomicrobiota bacterium]
MKGIGKRFPGVVALDGVNLDVYPGEIVGLIGENGAGKSTLMKILGGLYQPNEGTIRIEGRPTVFETVSDSMKAGIAFIHQELNVLDNIDVAGNVFLGREPLRTPFRLIHRQKIYAMTRPLLERLGLHVSPRTLLSDLSIAHQQMVEIAKALSLDARILIMDEPTSSLTLSETDRLLDLVVELKEQGVSIIYISHRLAELDRIADRVVALRDGRNAGALSREEIDHDVMVRMMVGRDIQHDYAAPKGEIVEGCFRAESIRTRAYPDKTVSLEAARGEILGIAGLVGSGRTEMVEAIFGVDETAEADIFLDGTEIHIRQAKDAIRQGIYLIPEDRRGTGLITQMVVRENITLPSVKGYTTAGLIDRDRETDVSNEQVGSLAVKTPNVETLVMNLSGGNQQKIVLGKWLSMEPKVLIFDEPTRGIDVKSKSEIYRLMRDLAENGAVIIMVSSDMEEILHVSDRVAVMHEGAISGVLSRDLATEENIMRLAVGRTAEELAESA